MCRNNIIVVVGPGPFRSVWEVLPCHINARREHLRVTCEIIDDSMLLEASRILSDRGSHLLKGTGLY